MIPYISHGPLIFWMYPVFGVRGATYFLGVSEWLFGALLFAGFWNKKLGVLGASGACGSFIATSTLIPFTSLMKDLIRLAVSFYLLKEGVIRASEPNALSEIEKTVLRNPEIATALKGSNIARKSTLGLG